MKPSRRPVPKESAEAPELHQESHPDRVWRRAPSRQEFRALFRANKERILRGCPRPRMIDPFLDWEIAPEAFDAMVEILEEASPKLWRERAASAWLLEQAKMSEGRRFHVAIALIDALNDRNLSTASRWMNWMMQGLKAGGAWLLGMGVLGGLAALSSLPNPLALRSVAWGLGVAGFPLIGYVAMRREMECIRITRLAAVHALARFRLPESVSVLCRLCFEKEYEKPATRALQETLPRLASEHYGHLSADITPNLCDLLMHCTPWNPELMFLLLEALGKVGDRNAIATLHKLKTAPIYANFPSPMRLRQTISSVLEAVSVRAQEEQEQETLLRGAEEPDAEYLRPAAPAPPEPPEELLRSVSRLNRSDKEDTQS